MASQLSIRLGIEPSRSIVIDKPIVVDTQLALAYILSNVQPSYKITDFTVTASYVGVDALAAFPAEDVYAMLDTHDRICHIQYNMIPPKRYYLPQHKPILSYMKTLMPNYRSTIIMETINDLYCETQTVELITKNKNPIGSKYRLYLDDILLTERFYPYKIIAEHLLLEEVSLELCGGLHTLRLENLNDNQVFIRDMMIDGKIISDIHALSYSFEV